MYGTTITPEDDARWDARIASELTRYWGFDTLRPLQRDAVMASLAGRDSVVVMPTGGGKSLCYQLPPLLRPDGQRALCLVVSPLIALMKDQVDGLKLAGYPAAALYSGHGSDDAGEVRRGLEQGRIKLLMTSPERLLTDGFLGLLSGLQARAQGGSGVASIAIDEAHCISQWGHDFRPEYRRLAELREVLPGVPVHAYTATATPRVREDIARQLHMQDPALLVGTFDRPNLTYRVLPRIGQGEDQIAAQLSQRAPNSEGNAAIVYCISRKQTESIADALTARGLKAEAYHAGLDPRHRAKVQDDFLQERLNIVVATVAFGMGIDRGDVRTVIHASMPKSVEAYQQETGRAGRDGLPSDCVLLYAASDVVRWGQLMERSASESEVDVPPEVIQAQRDLLNQIQRLATGTRCRHQALSEYFGQEYAPPASDPTSDGCGACDVCLLELEEIPDSTTIARKVLSCVGRLRGERNDAFGAVYVAEVLRGANTAKVLQRGHEKLSTWGLLKEMDKDTLVGFMNQLVDIGALARDGGEYPVLRLTGAAGPILRNEQPVRLLRARTANASSGTQRKRRLVDGTDAAVLSSDETGLFDALRALRRDIARDLGVPPYIVFGDAPLQEMAGVRPGTPAGFAAIKGVGRAKLEQFGDRFVSLIVSHCEQHGLQLGEAPRGLARPVSAPPAAPRESLRAATVLFERGLSVNEVAAQLSRARSTVAQYLVDWIESDKPESVASWVTDADYARITEAVAVVDSERLKPLFEHFSGEIPYETLKVVLTHRRVCGGHD